MYCMTSLSKGVICNIRFCAKVLSVMHTFCVKTYFIENISYLCFHKVTL